jgi:hypothetical protein
MDFKANIVTWCPLTLTLSPAGRGDQRFAARLNKKIKVLSTPSPLWGEGWGEGAAYIYFRVTQVIPANEGIQK